MTTASRHNGGSSTAIIELEPVHHISHAQRDSQSKNSQNLFARVLGRNETDSIQDEDRNESLPSPSIASQEVAERWNGSKMNIARILAAFWSFVVMGMNDATYGVSVAIAHEIICTA